MRRGGSEIFSHSKNISKKKNAAYEVLDMDGVLNWKVTWRIFFLNICTKSIVPSVLVRGQLIKSDPWFISQLMILFLPDTIKIIILYNIWRHKILKYARGCRISQARHA